MSFQNKFSFILILALIYSCSKKNVVPEECPIVNLEKYDYWTKFLIGKWKISDDNLSLENEIQCEYNQEYNLSSKESYELQFSYDGFLIVFKDGQIVNSNFISQVENIDSDSEDVIYKFELNCNKKNYVFVHYYKSGQYFEILEQVIHEDSLTKKNYIVESLYFERK